MYKVKISGLPFVKIQATAGAGLGRDDLPSGLLQSGRKMAIAQSVAIQLHCAPCWEKCLGRFGEQWCKR